ncbi:CD4-2 molecule, tandem duplicate 2 [Alosa sapidissima]|uniref:CD4-2 molecule, tandem duplicate 2 n=1 Tax=Alosa sapidissima TaxID=34773 RepID=UPI001C0907B5|nr:CD4-2 molecule, tandem duplicate 2 [Alosa sapidissima]
MWTKLFICFGLYIVVCKASGLQVYYGQAGKDLRLKCHDQSSEFTWKYESTQIISVVKSGRQTKGISELAERAKVFGSALQISNLKPKDSGTFTCITTDRKKQKSSSQITLHVFKVSVSVSPASPLLLSSAAKLTCQADGSPDNVTWKHNNQDKTAETGKTVALGNVEGSHAGKWQCLVYYGETQFEASLDIDVIGLKEHSNVTVKQGKDAVLPCTLSKSNLGPLRVVGGGWKQLSPAAADAPILPSLDTSNAEELRWNDDDIDAAEVTISEDILHTDFGISLIKVQPSQSGQYQCFVEFKDRGALTTTVTLEVTGGGGGGSVKKPGIPNNTVSVSVSPASPLLLSSAAKLTCDADGSPDNVTWKHKDNTFEGKSVTLDNVEGSHRGTWKCLVNYGESQSEASLDIDVIGLKEHSNVTVKQGKDAVLPCALSKSNLGPLRVVGGGWKQLSPAAADAPRLPSLDTSNAEELRWNTSDIDAAKVTISKERLTDFGIRLVKVQPSQSGQYRCSVEFKDRGALTTTVTLEVTGGGGGGGGGGSGRSSIGTPNPPTWFGLNMWIWVGVAVGSVVLIALVVAVALVHRSNKRRKMRMRKLRSVRKPLTANDYCQCNRPPRAVNLDRPVRVPRQQRPENIQMNGGYRGRAHI